jgi:hypothetical protein
LKEKLEEQSKTLGSLQNEKANKKSVADCVINIDKLNVTSEKYGRTIQSQRKTLEKHGSVIEVQQKTLDLHKKCHEWEKSKVYAIREIIEERTTELESKIDEKVATGGDNVSNLARKTKGKKSSKLPDGCENLANTDLSEEGNKARRYIKVSSNLYLLFIKNTTHLLIRNTP